VRPVRLVLPVCLVRPLRLPQPDRPERPAGAEQQGRLERPERPGKVEPLEHPEPPERLEQPERLGRLVHREKKASKVPIYLSWPTALKDLTAVIALHGSVVRSSAPSSKERD